MHCIDFILNKLFDFISDFISAKYRIDTKIQKIIFIICPLGVFVLREQCMHTKRGEIM